jgi:hypothetical protein
MNALLLPCPGRPARRMAVRRQPALRLSRKTFLLSRNKESLCSAKACLLRWFSLAGPRFTTGSFSCKPPARPFRSGLRLKAGLQCEETTIANHRQPP